MTDDRSAKLDSGSIFDMFADRRQVLRGLAGMATLTVAGAALSACQMRSAPQITLSQLMLDDGQQMRRYLDVVGTLPEAGFLSPTLPTGDLPVTALSTETSFLAAYDFDDDGTLTEGELTQGWLVQLAAERLGHPLKPDALKTFPRTAAATTSVPAPQALRGLALTSAESRAVRAALDGDKAGTIAMASAQEAINAEAAANGGDGGGGNGGPGVAGAPD